MINSLGINNSRRPKNIKNARFAITKVSLTDISKIIKEYKDVTYESYVRKRYKKMLTEIYFYLAKYLSKCMMRNLHGLV